MKSLQLRIAALLAFSIITVVFVATGVAAFFLLSDSDNDRMIGPLAGQILAIDRLYAGRDTPQLVSENQQLGPFRQDLTEKLRARLRQMHIDINVEVYDGVDDGERKLVTVDVGTDHLLIDFPSQPPPPRELWALLIRWQLFIVAGAIGLSVLISQRMTQPFTLMEKAIASVGPDGVLPHIPEEGNGEVRQTAATLNRLSLRLRTAMESRMRLVAAAGHDLRTPMTRMRLRAEFLSDEEREAWQRDIDELELIADNAIRLVREEVSSGLGEPVRIDTLLSECVDDLKDQGYAITQTGTAQATVLIGHWAMRRALRNLLINAATHGGGGCVRLETTRTMAHISIEDNGPGIPVDLIDKVFEPFFRAEPGRIQTVPGAGLGLAIAHEIVTRFDGTITIANRSPHGLIQTIELPLVEGEGVSSPA